MSPCPCYYNVPTLGWSLRKALDRKTVASGSFPNSTTELGTREAATRIEDIGSGREKEGGGGNEGGGEKEQR